MASFLSCSDQSPGKATACQFQYRINAIPQPMQLDITADGKTAQTVFEFTPGGDLRLQVQGIEPGKPRPTMLGDTATELQKISDDPALPPNTEVKRCI
ncbi:hypothetical protein K9N68_27490 [Kovacikia minuta CCNUW1]|uniref:hypothetical protein n=1 Tax=Kovacikia minuta TaxID=2931930 RepID=UPI001CCE03AA|nr:hypothetical protein [Kovacikia minuta]UBF25315.1 hypothetical protein K9N68_27490 [Kovacikia minuta CCNUW1]